jgi:formylglycine-generating enzyme required for sulfatase activity
LFAGLAPGWVGLYQINLQAPADRPSGPFALVVSTKDGSSQAGVQAEAVPAADLGGGLKMEFVPILSGEFMMGCSPGDTDCNSDEKPLHKVQITKSFELGKFEVTQAQWQAVMGSNPSYFQGSDRPVEQVSWNSIQTFLAKLNTRNDGYHYRLPTEAEWEYAARAGSTGPYYGRLADVAWCDNNSGSQTHPVGQKAPNSWGLYDMLGNVWEWCQDWYDESYYSRSPVADPPGASGSRKVLRGVSWYYEFSWLWRVSVRGYVEPGFGNFDVGFRCVRER